MKKLLLIILVLAASTTFAQKSFKEEMKEVDKFREKILADIHENQQNYKVIPAPVSNECRYLYHHEVIYPARPPYPDGSALARTYENFPNTRSGHGYYQPIVYTIRLW